MFRNKTFASEFCSLVSNWFDMREQAPGANLLHAGLFQEQVPLCVLKFACRDLTCLQLAKQIGLFFFSSHAPIWLLHHSAPSSCPSCVPFVGVLTRERVSGACFRSKLPRVYRPSDVQLQRAPLTNRHCVSKVESSTMT